MSAPSVLSLTGNLLCERTLQFDEWAAGRTQRARSASFQVGGKGINVSRMLQRLGVPVTALGFTGGATGLECEEWLRTQKFSFRTFPTTRATRVGIVIRSEGQPETTFFSPDVPPDLAAVRAAAEFLDRQASGQILAVCGSIPGWNTADLEPLRGAFQRWLARGPLAVDTYGPPLAWLAGQPLALIKINAVELRTLFPAERMQSATEDLLRAASQKFPVKQWIVTDGPAAVWYCDAGGRPASLRPPVITEVSPTGSGDVLFACVLDAHFRRGLPLASAVEFALPYAAANAAHPGIAEFELPHG